MKKKKKKKRCNKTAEKYHNSQRRVLQCGKYKFSRISAQAAASPKNTSQKYSPSEVQQPVLQEKYAWKGSSHNHEDHLRVCGCVSHIPKASLLLDIISRCCILSLRCFSGNLRHSRNTRAERSAAKNLVLFHYYPFFFFLHFKNGGKTWNVETLRRFCSSSRVYVVKAATDSD